MVDDRQRRLVLARSLMWGSRVESASDKLARSLTEGTTTRDWVILARLFFDHDGRALPSDLIGDVYTTSTGISGSLRRMRQAGWIVDGESKDARMHPVAITEIGKAAVDVGAPAWDTHADEMLAPLTSEEAEQLGRLLALLCE